MRLLLLLAIGACSLSAASAADKRAAVSLQCYAPGTTERVETVKAGEQFDLVLTVQDLRPEGTYVSQHPKTFGQTIPLLRGPFAAYASVSFNKRYSTAANFLAISPFVNGTRCFQNNYGLARWGGFTYGQVPVDDDGNEIPTARLEVSRVRMTATWPDGVLTSITSTSQLFRIHYAYLLAPHDDTLLLGNTAVIPPDQGTVRSDQIETTGATIRILK